MKKYLLIAVLAVASLAAYAQPRAIGANLGSGLGFSYQHGFGESNMLDVNASVPVLTGWGIGGSVTYDWIDPFNAPVPWNEKGEWHWYMGVGGTAGIYDFSNIAWNAGVAGHIGIEYDFWFPLQLSLDWRPNIGVTNYAGAGNDHKLGFNHWGLYSGISLGVRYKF